MYFLYLLILLYSTKSPLMCSHDRCSGLEVQRRPRAENPQSTLSPFLLYILFVLLYFPSFSVVERSLLFFKSARLGIAVHCFSQDSDDERRSSLRSQHGKLYSTPKLSRILPAKGGPKIGLTQKVCIELNFQGPFGL